MCRPGAPTVDAPGTSGRTSCGIDVRRVALVEEGCVEREGIAAEHAHIGGIRSEVDLGGLRAPGIALDGDHPETHLGQCPRIDPEAAPDVRHGQVADGVGRAEESGQASGAVARHLPARGLLECLLLEDHLRGPGPETVLAPPLEPHLGGQGGDEGWVDLRMLPAQGGQGSRIGRVREGGDLAAEGPSLGGDQVAGLGRGHRGRVGHGGGPGLALGLTEC